MIGLDRINKYCIVLSRIINYSCTVIAGRGERVKKKLPEMVAFLIVVIYINLR